MSLKICEAFIKWNVHYKEASPEVELRPWNLNKPLDSVLVHIYSLMGSE